MYINSDCFEYFKNIDNESIDLIVTDPPYGIEFKGVTSDTSWDSIDDYQKFMSDFLTEVKRILKPDGVCWLFCARTKFLEISNIIDNIGLQNNLKYWLTYARNKGRGATKRPKSVAEEILCISKSDNFYFSNIDYLREVVTPYVKNGKPRGWFVDQNTGQRVRWSGLGNVLCFSSPFHLNKFEKQIHSTQKPFLLMCELILTTSKEGDTVLDPFMGSGVCGIACDVLNRNFIGIEKDMDMYNKACTWFKNYDKTMIIEYVGQRLNFPSKQDLWGNKD